MNKYERKAHVARMRSQMAVELFHVDQDYDPFVGLTITQFRTYGRRPNEGRKVENTYDKAWLMSGRRSRVDSDLAMRMGHTTSTPGRRASVKRKAR